VLRRVGEHLEVVSNGVFLMDTRDGRSERLLVRADTVHNARDDLAEIDEPVVLIHGGNAEFSRLSAALGMPPRMITSVIMPARPSTTRRQPSVSPAMSGTRRSSPKPSGRSSFLRPAWDARRPRRRSSEHSRASR